MWLFCRVLYPFIAATFYRKVGKKHNPRPLSSDVTFDVGTWTLARSTKKWHLKKIANYPTVSRMHQFWDAKRWPYGIIGTVRGAFIAKMPAPWNTRRAVCNPRCTLLLLSQERVYIHTATPPTRVCALTRCTLTFIGWRFAAEAFEAYIYRTL